MRFLLSALLLSASVPSLCQTAAQPVDLDQIFRLPDTFQQPLHDSSKPPSFKVQMEIIPATNVVIPNQAPKFGDPHIDDQIVRKPRQENFSHHQPRTPRAAGIYPDLQLLPIQSAH